MESFTIRWRAGTGISGGDVEKIFSRYHVLILKRHFRENGEYGVTVQAHQRVWAEYLLLRSGIDVTSPLHKRNLGVLPGPMPKPFSRKGKEKKQPGLTAFIVRCFHALTSR